MCSGNAVGRMQNCLPVAVLLGDGSKIDAPVAPHVTTQYRCFPGIFDDGDSDALRPVGPKSFSDWLEVEPLSNASEHLMVDSRQAVRTHRFTPTCSSIYHGLLSGQESDLITYLHSWYQINATFGAHEPASDESWDWSSPRCGSVHSILRVPSEAIFHPEV